MFLDYILDHFWLAIGLWVLLYFLDYYFTLKAARMYQAGVNKHMVFAGGYELNPVFKDDIAALRRFSYRFFLLLILFGSLMFLLYILAPKPLFGFSLGLIIGVQITVHMRHIRNLAIFSFAKHSRGISGKIEYEHWLSLRLSAIELFTYTLLFLIFLIACPNFFILGCAVGCFVVGWRHLTDSKQKPGELPDAATQ